MRYILHSMRSDETDPVGTGGDMRSWFFFYKWRAGVTGIKAFADGESYSDVVQKGDRIVFCMDGAVVAVAPVLEVEYSIPWNCNEVFFDSDSMLIPKRFENHGMLCYCMPADGCVYRHIDQVAADAVPLSDIPEGEEPEWLKNFLTKRPR